MRRFYLVAITILWSLMIHAVTVEIDGIAYYINLKTGLTEVTSNATHPYSGDIVIAEKIVYEETEYTVTAIGERAFFQKNITSVTFPKSITTIGKQAFEGCMLQNVFVENEHTQILDNSFSQATYNHAMLYIPKDKWMEAVYHGDFWRFINIRETVTNTGNLSEMQTYTMMNRNTFGYMVYDAANDRTTITNGYYNVDENALNNCWQILKKDGDDYLYNIGAGKYATFNTDG